MDDPELEGALRNFRLSVCSWSETAYSRPRRAAATYQRRVWRLAAGWALGCALTVGAASAGIYQYEHGQEMARQRAAAVAERQAAEAKAAAAVAPAAELNEDDEELLAKVDSDVSREVPSALEPLAQLAEEDASE
jgi:malonyl CoA-acyl carrier protein transacylase